jgi:hypothetical protein
MTVVLPLLLSFFYPTFFTPIGQPGVGILPWAIDNRKLEATAEVGLWKNLVLFCWN